jgi:hypothetical protein
LKISLYELAISDGNLQEDIDYLDIRLEELENFQGEESEKKKKFLADQKHKELLVDHLRERATADESRIEELQSLSRQLKSQVTSQEASQTKLLRQFIELVGVLL